MGFLKKNYKHCGTHNEIVTVDKTPFLSYFNIYKEKERVLIFFDIDFFRIQVQFCG